MHGRTGTRGPVARLIGLALVTTIASLGLCASASATQISWTFDSDNQGWLQNQDQASTNFTPAGFQSTGGNPGGHLWAQDTGPENGCPKGNPCQLLTFYSPPIPAMSANYGGTASVDLASPKEDPAFPAEFLLLPPGPNYLDGLVPEVIGTGYHHLSISLTEAALSGNDPAWAVCPYIGGTCTPPSQQQFKDLIAASDLVGVMADVGPNGTGETYSLDNVSLTDGPPTQPPPHKCKKKKKNRAAVAKKKKCKKKKRKGRAVSARLRG